MLYEFELLVLVCSYKRMFLRSISSCYGVHPAVTEIFLNRPINRFYDIQGLVEATFFRRWQVFLLLIQYFTLAVFMGLGYVRSVDLTSRPRLAQLGVGYDLSSYVNNGISFVVWCSFFLKLKVNTVFYLCLSLKN